MLKEEQIKRRIHLSFDRHDILKEESVEVRSYFEKIIRLTYQGLEMDNDGEKHTSSQNLKFAIEVTIYDDFQMIYEEAKREAKRQ